MGATSYSTTVRGWLEVNGQQLELAQLGPEFCYVRAPVDLPPMHADLFVSVDGDIRRRTVFLPHGISRQTAKVAVNMNGAVISQAPNGQSAP